MLEYTQELWKVEEWYSDCGSRVRGIISADGTEVLGERNPSEADAHRIVAAVNACEGISTEALEAGVVKQLLEALRKATILTERCAAPKGLIEFDWAWLNDVSRIGREIKEELHAAVATAKGEKRK